MSEPPNANDYDLFVSYAHADNRGPHAGWVERLVEAIQAEHRRFSPQPLKVFLDLEDIRTMDDWEHRILVGLRHARVMLAVLSPAYFRSPFCRREWKTYCDHEVDRAMLGEGIAPIYIVRTPAFDDASQATLDEWIQDLKARQYLDVQDLWTEGIHALQREDVRKRMERLDQDISARLDRAERFLKAPTTVPPHNRNFVGRREELRQLRDTLTAGQVGAITAVHGLAGIGKSALAFEYAHAFAHEYPGGRFLIAAAGVDDLRGPIVNLAEQKGVTLITEERKDLDAAYARVRAAFEHEPFPSLWVLDNVDAPALLAPAWRSRYLPDGRKVHVLVTTRLEPERLRGLHCLALEALPEADALALLEKHRPFAGEDEWKAAVKIVRRLGGHALAVEVVAVYLWQTPEVSYVAFQARLEREGLGAVEGAGRDEWVQLSRHVEKLLGPLLEPTLAGLSPAERLAVEYAALLPPDWIALPWLRVLVGRQFPEMIQEPEPGYPNPWAQLKRRLKGLRLVVGTDDETKAARMHRLVQDVVQERMEATLRAEREHSLWEHADLRGYYIFERWFEHKNQWEIRPLRYYVELLMSRNDPRGAGIANGVQGPLVNIGQFDTARQLLQQAIAIEEKTLESGHSLLAIRYANLAMVELKLGNPAAAHLLLQKTLAIQDEVLAADHPNFATSYSNLALVEQYLGNLAEARCMLRKAIVIQEKVFAPDHPHLMVSYSNLATVERELGNLAEARRLLELAIAIGEKIYDPDHPNLAAVYNNLSYFEADLGNLAGARRLMRQALAILEKRLGKDHPHTRSSAQWLSDHDTDTENGDDAP